MQIVTVLVVAVLVPSLTEALIMTKCQLKSALEAASIDNADMTQPDYIANIVCNVEKITGLNTGAVNRQVIPADLYTSNGDSDEDSSSEEQPDQVVSLYGLFQLSELVFCSSGPAESLNLCQMNCTALIDDDISDDIACLQTRKLKVDSSPAAIQDSLWEMYNYFSLAECAAVVDSTYFADC